MASDDYEINWDDDDAFGGDIDFDMDFNMDPFAGRSFISTFGTGFLDGIGGSLWSNEGAKMRTLRTILPSSFSTGLDRLSFVGDRIDQLAKEFKEENYETAKSLQSIAKQLSQRMGDKLPGSVVDRLDNFSQKDFTDWERLDETSPSKNRMDSVTEDDISSTVEGLLNSQSSMFASLGDSLNQMTAAATSSIQSAIGAGNRQLVNIESSIRDVLNYQRNVQARMDQAKINLMARSYVQDAKFYKFMEAGIHEQVNELKKISKFTKMSDYEKTSEFQQSKKYIRSQVYNAIGDRLGGFSNYIGRRFSKGNRNEAYGAVGGIINNLAMGLDMAEGQELSQGFFGDMLGKMAAEVAIEQLPIFFTRGPGKKAVDAMIKKYPEQAKYIKEQVKQITDIGNIVSYASTSGIGMVNHLAENFKSIDEMKYYDYEDYLSTLDVNDRAIPKAIWTVMNATSNRAKASINKMMADVDKSRGTQYTMAKRDLKDLTKPGIWKEMNNITLNEVLPGLISKTNQILENMRTGRNDNEATSYNYMRGQFQTDSQKRVSAQADLMPYNSFQTYANNALALVESLDPGKLFDPETKKVFAQRVARDIDADKGFNPYYYMGNVPGIPDKQLKLIQDVLKIHFGITDQDVTEFTEADGFQQMKKMAVMPTSEGKHRLNYASAAALNMRNHFPNIAERIDLLRSTGNEQLLRDLGIIYTQDGLDRINMQTFHDRIAMHMDDPNNPLLRGMTGPVGTEGNGPTTIKSFGDNGSGNQTGSALTDLNVTLQGLNQHLAGMNKNDPRDNSPATVNFDTMTGELTQIKDSNKGIFENSTNLNKMFTEMLDIIKSGGILVGRAKTKSEKKEEAAVNRSLWEHFKSKYPADALTGGVRGLGKFMINNPIVSGTLLGGVGAAVFSNPYAAAGAAAAGIGIGLYGEWLNRNNKGKTETGSEPSEDEDILDENGEPILTAKKKNIGDYVDSASRSVIKFWSDIKGPVYDTATKAVIGVKDLAGKIFGPDGRAVMLKGLRSVRDAAKSAYNLANPLGRLRSLIETGKEFVFQQDVYVKGEKEPRLRAVGFKSNDYFVRDESGNFTPISGWNEINGPVYDGDGNQLISKEEYTEGLVTSSGRAVRQAGAFTSSVIGAAAGLGRRGFDGLMGKFGYNKGPASGKGNAAGAGPSGTTGVEKRLDKIYRMMSQWSGIGMEDDSIAAAFAGGSTGGPDTGGLRLNSLAYKAKEAEHEEKHKVNQAIINISEHMGDLTDGKKGDKGEKKGIFGKLGEMLMGLGGFAKNLIKNPIGTIGNLVFGSLMKSSKRLATMGSLLFSGVMGAASPIYKLLKWGFTSLAKAFTLSKLGRGARGGLGDLADDIGDVEQRGQSGKRKRKKGSARRGGKASGGKGLFSRAGRFVPGPLKFAAMAYAGKEAVDMFSDDENEDGTKNLEVGERDPVTGRYKTWTDKGMDMITNWLPTGIVADMGVTALAGKDNMKKWDDYGLFWGSDGKMFMTRQGRDKHEDDIRGVAHTGAGEYKQVQEPGDDKMTIQKEMRFAMYGVVDVETQLARRVMMLENLLYPFVVIKGNRASFKPDAPIDKLLQQFMAADGQPMKDADAVHTWFTARFKPVFLIFNAAISVARMGDIKEYDRAKSYDVVQVLERVQESLASLTPNPYNIDVRIDSRTGTMGPEDTVRWLGILKARLDKEFPKPKDETVKIATAVESQEKVKAQVGNAGKDVTHQDAFQDVMGARAAKASMDMANAKFQQPKDVTSIDISDMISGKDQPLDPFTALRLAIYGNVDNMSWRCEAVLRLERYMEDFILIAGGDARFTGKSAQILELFKPSFRINNDKASNNWMTWFRDRFLPVMMTYMKEVRRLRGTTPSRGWKQMSATNKAEVGRKLSEQVVTVDDQQKTVWEIEAGPFPNSKSGTWSDKATTFLEQLDRKAQEARLKDPEMEEAQSAATPSNDDVMQRGQNASVRERTQSALAEVYGGSFGKSPGNMTAADGLPTGRGFGGAVPNATMDAGGGAGSAGAFTGQANSNFNPEFIKQAGEDKGIKMSLQQGEQLMLNHLIKAGFRDNKVLALALAMARKETGGYQATVENTNWSAPTLLKYFKNVPDQATAQKVAAMSPAERAMFVYGRAPKGPSLGNTKPEDGWNYRGRGLFQLTGKANYEKFKKETGIDVVSNPRLVSEDPNVMAESAVRFLKNSPAMLSIAKTGDFETAVRGINGGNAVPATDERRKYYQDYLNKLRSGELGIEGTDDKGADASTMDAPTPSENTPPQAADKNVPADKLDGNEAVGTAGKAGSTKDMLAASESTPSNVGNKPSLDNAADLGPGSTGTPYVKDEQAGTIGKSSGIPTKEVGKLIKDEGDGTVGILAGPAAKPQEPVKPQAPAPVPQVNVPDRITTTDEISAKLQAAGNQTLLEILAVLKRNQGNKDSIVSMS